MLVEVEKLFSKVDFEFERCIKFCKMCYNQQNIELINETYFALTMNLVHLLDDRILAFYKNLFFAKKIQTIKACIDICFQYYYYIFGYFFFSY